MNNSFVKLLYSIRIELVENTALIRYCFKLGCLVLRYYGINIILKHEEAILSITNYFSNICLLLFFFFKVIFKNMLF